MTDVEVSGDQNDCFESKCDIVYVDVSSGDDTDYEAVDDYTHLEPKVLEVHLNCSSSSGNSVITVEDDDLKIIDEKFKQSTESTGYNNSKYFSKEKRFYSQISTEIVCENSKPHREKKLKMKNDNDDVTVVNDEDTGEIENNTDIEDIKTNIAKEEDDGLDNLGSRDKELLAKLEKIRRWRMTGLGEALEAGEKKPCVTDIKFRVLSYNILAQKHLTGHLNLYRGKQQYLLDWDYRWTGIKREVQASSADIVTFQEVQFSSPDHFNQQIRPWFAQLGYEVVSQCRTGGKVDGCAIFFRRDKFSLVTFKGVEYKQEDIPVLNKDNIGIVCCLTASNGARVAIATTHLLFNPKREEIRLAQTALLLAELDHLAWDSQCEGHLPVIVTGDLNLQPYSDTYNLITKGGVRYAGLPCGRSLLPDQLLPVHLGISDTCQKVTELTKRCVSPQFGSGSFSHQFGFRSVYNHSRHLNTRVPVGGYEATTFHSSWVTVDYIFYSTVQSRQAASKDGRQEGRLKLLGRQSLLTGPEISALGGLPSTICPSDHLPLLAEFLLKI
eukprot:GFUD01113246.1.p1 GENE.GFUD01113246.1~~GFUD01113246.1.p1  ORF type:complete len:553 (-),score=163.57 GFUD01113246.1:65-1723(-)